MILFFLIMLIYIVLHELVHGLFYKILTKEKLTAKDDKGKLTAYEIPKTLSNYSINGKNPPLLFKPEKKQGNI